VRKTRSRPEAGAVTSDAASDADRRRVLAAASLLLGYPDRDLLDQLPLLRRATATLPAPAGPALTRFVDRLERTPLESLSAEYVDTFDLHRRRCLYLTYYAFGDTRKRGAALVRFTHEYRQAGLDPPAGELPDHLAVVCHFAALAPAPGARLLADHRAAIELVHLSLVEAGSAYVDVLVALRSVLPEPAERDLATALDLARRGPPAEEVGLEPFGPPEHTGASRR
jgi:nitrate reductase delta subunit